MFVDPARAKEYECVVCLDIYKDPVQIGCEDHIFCKQCIDQLISINGNSFCCPLCKVECTADDVTRVKFIARQIADLQVKCPNTTANKKFITTQKNDNKIRRSTRLKQQTNSETGQKRERSFDNENEDNSNHNKRRKLNANDSCEWQGRYSDLNNHMKMCPLQLVSCKHCSGHILQKELNEHYKECPVYPLKCVQCNEEGIVRSRMPIHISKFCPITLISCRKCKQEIKREDVQVHLEKECSETLIECPFYRFGCKDKLKRKDERKHIENAVLTHTHLRQMAAHQLKLENTVNELKNEIKSVFNVLQNNQIQSENRLNAKIAQLPKHYCLMSNKVKPWIQILDANIEYVPQWVKCNSCRKWRIFRVSTNEITTWQEPLGWQCSYAEPPNNSCRLPQENPDPSQYSALQFSALTIQRQIKIEQSQKVCF